MSVAVDPSIVLPSLSTYQEKASHLNYLKDFRVEPCPLFKQHQCQHHRPYMCFYWHFANQKRRRPSRKKDLTFNYSADVYCAKYDENTGVCPDGDDCPYLHRVYGDVERKYHLRYYKTACCVHTTDSKGVCSKNGPHCAFAHGPDDLRNPIFDIRELQGSGPSTETVDRDRLSFVVEDPIWQDQDYVLANYKTEICKKPPRLCRQGYACPHYHNSKDKRRPPTALDGSDPPIPKYKSTPCPDVKKSDEWGDPEHCDAGDGCQYCHTRTEQQFHPEIYKSTRCNDMQLHAYCPRGPFCAFAHSEAEMHADRCFIKTALLSSDSSSTHSTTSRNVEIPSGLVQKLSSVPCPSLQASYDLINRRVSLDTAYWQASNGDVGKSSSDVNAPITAISVEHLKSGSMNPSCGSSVATSAAFIQQSQAPSYSAVLKQRHHSESSRSPKTFAFSESPPDESMWIAGAYSKAPGFERESSPPKSKSSLTDDSIRGVSPNQTSAVSKIKANLYLSHEIGCDITPASFKASSTAVDVAPAAVSAVPQSLWSPGQELNYPSSTVTSVNETMLPFTHNCPSDSRTLYATGIGSIKSATNDNSVSNVSSGANYFSIAASDQSPQKFKLSGIDSLAKPGLHDNVVSGLSNTVFSAELARTREELIYYRNKSTCLEEEMKHLKLSLENWKKRAEDCKRRELQAVQDRNTAAARLMVLDNKVQNSVWNGYNACMNGVEANKSTLEHVQQQQQQFPPNALSSYPISIGCCTKCGQLLSNVDPYSSNLCSSCSSIVRHNSVLRSSIDGRDQQHSTAVVN